MNKKLFRTLIRVVKKTSDEVEFIAPGYSTTEIIVLPKKYVPDSVFTVMKPGFRCHVKMNIGAESGEDLIFKNWENE
jgi:hypothetical protein